jgi:endoglucanase
MARATERLVAAGACAVLTATLASAPGLSRTAAAGAPPSLAAAVPGQIRVNQQGYLPHESKKAMLMAPRAVKHGTFVVTDDAGRVVLRGHVPSASTGSWNKRFPDVYRLDLSRLRTPGRYRVVVAGAVRATSPWFRVTGASRLFGTLLDSGVAFDQTQRDGRHVVRGRLHRRPSHMHDRRATVYRWPRMARGSDLITDRRLHPLGGATVDVAGGWFDAGDYLKFTHSTAYNDVLLFTSARLLGHRAPAALTTEARYGLHWLEKMWDARTRTLYIQVGIGSGNRAGTFRGDHDLWRLPQADDRDHAHQDRFVSHRPVLAAAPAGSPISPNLVGRVVASFALAAQADARDHRARAQRELRQARLLYAMAATTGPPHPLVTALPHAFYPESSWLDDMELGSAELALAAHDLAVPADQYLRDSAGFARRYLDSRSTDTLNLYDTGALADVSLARAMSEVRGAGPLAVTRRDLTRNLRSQIMRGVRHARHDPFRAAVSVDDFDVNSHTFGLVATVGLYDALTHSDRFQSFATAQRTWLLGGDPWGVTAMVGVGHAFPNCMQHQVANLAGRLDGRLPLDIGAVVNGPNGKGNFDGGLGGFQTGMLPCTSASRQLTRFDGHGSRYVDDVRAWQTDEPALDMTGAAVIAAAAQLHLHPHAPVRTPRSGTR